MTPLLKIEDLSVQYASGRVASQALCGVSCEIHSGEVVGILGESGCGKSTLALAILGVLPPSAESSRGSIQFRGHELMSLSEREMRSIRGAQISLIGQEPVMALNPVRRVGSQVADVVAAHNDWSGDRCREVALEVLSEVGLREPDLISRAYPHQLSGGQRQRIVIAQALACRPALLVADEPTSSLDTTLQREILELLKKLRSSHGLTILLIGHNPAVLAEIADRILVLYAGQVVEEGRAEDVLNSPFHPYTQALLRCLPRRREGRAQFQTIPGEPPNMVAPPPGCSFAPRCGERMDVCLLRSPQDFYPVEDRRVRCFKYGG